MASKARKGEDLLADLDQLGSEDTPASSSTTAKPPSAPKPAAVSNDADDSVLGDIEKQLAVKSAGERGTSRPTTPRMSSSTTSGGTNKSPKRAEHTPASSGPPSGRTSEDRLRNVSNSNNAGVGGQRSSGEGAARSYHQSSAPSQDVLAARQEEKVMGESGKPIASSSSGSGGGGGGGWWGSMFSAASAAVKQAETLAKEIRSNEEAQRWAEQVRGNISNLQTFSTDLRTRALPTFTSLISHIAPPISAHERLQIHTTHDLLNYPSLDPLIYSIFSRVMAQVEGGDLLVIQRGSSNTSRPRTTSSSEGQGYRGGVLGSGGGWTDGPWWREESQKRDLGAVTGLKEGTRLVRVSAEAYAKEFFDSRGGVEEAAKKATETLSETNPVRSSDIFLAIQAISYPANADLFAGDSSEKSKAGGEEEGGGDGVVVVDPEEEPEDLLTFAIYLHDPIHSLSFATLSQPFPQRWAAWIDAAAASNSTSSPEDSNQQVLPDSILEIIQSGGVDPREWVAEWMEEVLSLGVGVVAQRYVARRMGVGMGGLGRGKRRAEEDGVGGEAARAI